MWAGPAERGPVTSQTLGMTTEGDTLEASVREQVGAVLPEGVDVESVELRGGAGLALVYLTFPDGLAERQRLGLAERLHADLATVTLADDGVELILAPVVVPRGDASPTA